MIIGIRVCKRLADARGIEILPLIYAFYSAICVRGTSDAKRDILEYTYKEYYEYGVEK